jgi:hypothetical protein
MTAHAVSGMSVRTSRAGSADMLLTLITEACAAWS